MPELAEHFRVIRYDARGHGASPAPSGPYTIDDFAEDLIQLLDRHGVDAAYIAGISLGGMTAMAFAATHPERVNRLRPGLHVSAPRSARAWADRAAKVQAAVPPPSRTPSSRAGPPRRTRPPIPGS